MISVLMAVYNGQDCLPRTIESVLRQTCRDFEFIIVDDGSTDSSVQVVRSFDDDRIVLHLNESNIGQTRSLNVGLGLARGKYVARMDAGDLSLPDRLRRQVRFMEHHGQYAAVGTAAAMVTPQGKRIGTARRPRRFREILLRMFYVSPLIHISAMMHRRTVLEMGGYDEDFPIAADHELWSKLVRSGYRLTNLRAALVAWEVDPGSLSFEHLSGRVTQEAPRIIRRNAEALAGVTISIEEAREIFSMFTFGLHTLAQDSIERAEALFARIFASLRKDLCSDMTDRAVRRHLARNYLKLALHHMRQGRGQPARLALHEGRIRHGFQWAHPVLWALSFLPKGLAARLRRPGLQ